MDVFLAHISEDGREQTVREHLEGTARLAEEYASVFHLADQGKLAGMMHDIGKYSTAFQKRLKGGSKVDHSTAGALECMERGQIPAAFCIAGHHSGIPNLGSRTDLEGKALFARLNRAQQNGLEPYGAWLREIEMPNSSIPSFCADSLSAVFYVRMLYSCLVDADYTDTESFMTGEMRKGEKPNFNHLNCMLDQYVEPWFPPVSELNRKRCAILRECMERGETAEPGLFTLTVPTGGGKTIASLAFALRHAKRNHLSRIIYVIPYTSIIEQTAEIFRNVLGAENILEHHSGVQLETETTDIRTAKSVENWDAPIIVTTAVQFFESLYSNKPSKCRKLHNIAGSVVVFDEAQMMPLPYLRPCVHSIAQLVAHYNASAVLCTATQPALSALFDEYLPDTPAKEICSEWLFEDPLFRRVSIKNAGVMSSESVSNRMNQEKQTLCIVNSRKNAQELFALLNRDGAFHLSTLMYPAHRKRVLQEIRSRLKSGLPCRVVSTSLIEAGVDVDFPAVFREVAGLDSILQAAGRCNREGKRPSEDSIVTVFQPEGAVPPLFEPMIAAAQMTMGTHGNLFSKEAVNDYYARLLGIKGDFALDRHGILKQLKEDGFPFESVAEQFRLIEQDTKTVYIPEGQGAELVAKLRVGKCSGKLYRALDQYSLSVYTEHFERLKNAGVLELMDDGSAVLTDLSVYDQKTGMMLEPESGKALFI